MDVGVQKDKVSLAMILLDSSSIFFYRMMFTKSNMFQDENESIAP